MNTCVNVIFRIDADYGQWSDDDGTDNNDFTARDM